MIHKDTLKAVSFFKSDSGYVKLIQAMIKKVQRDGRFSGTFTLKNLSNSEQSALSSFFRIDIRQTTYSTTFEKFEGMLKRTSFQNVGLINLLETYAGTELISNKQKSVLRRDNRNEFFQRLKDKFIDENSRFVLNQLPRSYLRLYEQDINRAAVSFETIFLALSKLPLDRYERLPVFAERLTKDPHSFDNDRLGKLFIDGLRVIFDIKETINSELESELYASVGLLKDDIHNFVSIAGLSSNFSYWAVANKEKSVLNIPLREANRLTWAAPVVGKEVYIVENSGLFSAIMDQFDEWLPPLICVHGQPRMSSLLVLDRLAQSGAILFYAGDFDPEGLLICDRLIKRYRGQLVPWYMSKENYVACKSHVSIPPRRLAILRNVNEKVLIEVKEYMIEKQIAGYQESFLHDMVDYMIKGNKQVMGENNNF